VRHGRSQAAAARGKGDTPQVTRLPRTSAHGHEYNASGVVLQAGSGGGGDGSAGAMVSIDKGSLYLAR